MITPATLAFLQGLGMGASMIMAIGPQNALLIRQGIRRNKAWTIASTFIVIDVCLITLGALGVGVIVSQFDWLRIGLGSAAVLVLTVLAIGHFRSALKANQVTIGSGKSMSTLAAVGLAASVSVLNPAVLFDTVILIGGLAAQYSDMHAKSMFTLGAIIASIVWFSLLAAGAVRFAPIFQTPRALRVLDIVIGCLMLGVAALVVVRLWP